jgi:lysozyme family protein
MNSIIDACVNQWTLSENSNRKFCHIHYTNVLVHRRWVQCLHHGATRTVEVKDRIHRVDQQTSQPKHFEWAWHPKRHCLFLTEQLQNDQLAAVFHCVPHGSAAATSNVACTSDHTTHNCKIRCQQLKNSKGWNSGYQIVLINRL